MSDCAILLGDANVLALDCQSTGANPARGHLIEIGWVRAGEAGSSAPATYLVRLPDGAVIPEQVRKLTGIEPADLDAAIEPARAWESLCRAAEEAARGLGGGAAIAVIHHARFEMPFLRQLHEAHGGGRPFPLDVFCTREIARLLLPELPRRGLRALGGYFGLTVPQLRRCADHVAATTFVWRRLAELIESRHGVRTFGELREWLAQARPEKRPRAYPMARERRLGLPDGPGVYRFRRRNGDILYVGKAASLRRRVNSYFQKRKGHAERSLEMLTQAYSIETTATETALEAALIESDEIKRHNPPYNVALRADGRSIWFASGDFRAVGDRPGRDLTLGPFPSSGAATAFATLCELLRGAEPKAGMAERLLGVRPERAPEPKCLEEGLSIFRRGCVSSERFEPLERGLVRLGASLWLERLAEIERARLEGAEEKDDEPSEPGEGPPAPAGPPAWDPGRVAEAAKGVVLRAAHQLRRADWLCRVSECSVAWREGADAPGRVIVFERGIPIARHPSIGGAPPDLPRGHGRPRLERQASFDIAAYDRLQALTTELRRLAGERDVLWLRLGPNRILDGGDVARALRWI